MAERTDNGAVGSSSSHDIVNDMGITIKKLRVSSEPEANSLDYDKTIRSSYICQNSDRQIVAFNRQVLMAHEARSRTLPRLKPEPEPPLHKSIVSGQSRRAMDNVWYLLESALNISLMYLQPKYAPKNVALRVKMGFRLIDGQVVPQVSCPWGQQHESASLVVEAAMALALAWGHRLIPSGWSAINFDCELVDSSLYVMDLLLDPNQVNTFRTEQRMFCSRWSVVRAIFDAAPGGLLEQFNQRKDARVDILLAPTIDLAVFVDNYLSREFIVTLKELQQKYSLAITMENPYAVGFDRANYFRRGLSRFEDHDEWSKPMQDCILRLCSEIESSFLNKFVSAGPCSGIYLKPKFQNSLPSRMRSIDDIIGSDEPLRLDLVVGYVIDWAHDASERNANLVAYPGCNVGSCQLGHLGTYHPARITVSDVPYVPNEFVATPANSSGGPVFVSTHLHWGWDALNLLLAIGSAIVPSDLAAGDFQDVLWEDILKYVGRHIDGSTRADVAECERKFLAIDRTDRSALAQGIRKLYSRHKIPALQIHVLTAARRGRGRTLYSYHETRGVLLDCTRLASGSPTLTINDIRTKPTKSDKNLSSDCLYLDDHRFIFANDIVTRSLSVGDACVCSNQSYRNPIRATYHRMDVDTTTLIAEAPGQWFDTLQRERRETFPRQAGAAAS